jgi:hypothetical protein
MKEQLLAERAEAMDKMSRLALALMNRNSKPQHIRVKMIQVNNRINKIEEALAMCIPNPTVKE